MPRRPDTATSAVSIERESLAGQRRAHSTATAPDATVSGTKHTQGERVYSCSPGGPVVR